MIATLTCFLPFLFPKAELPSHITPFKHPCLLPTACYSRSQLKAPARQVAPSSELAGPKAGLDWNTSMELKQCNSPLLECLSVGKTPVAHPICCHPGISLVRHSVTEISPTLEGQNLGRAECQVLQDGLVSHCRLRGFQRFA